jgi:hypothetical protein
MKRLSSGGISIFFCSDEDTPSRLILKKESLPPAIATELISMGRLLRLYTLKLRVADPMVVNIVSKVIVSCEKEGRAFGSGSSLSRSQDWEVTSSTKKTLEIRTILKMVDKE